MKSVGEEHLPDFSLPYLSRYRLVVSAPGPASVAGIKVAKLVSVITVLSLTVSSNTCFLINWTIFSLWVKNSLHISQTELEVMKLYTQTIVWAP